MGCSFIQCNIQGLFPTSSGKKICYKTLYISDLTELQVCNETHTKPNGQLKIRPQALLLKEKSVETIFEDLFLLIYT